jgi:hypothetical protein
MTTAGSLENLLERVKSSSALESLAAAEQLATLYRDAQATAAPFFQAYQEQVRKGDRDLKAVTRSNQELAEAIRVAFGTSSGVKDVFERAVLEAAAFGRLNEDVLEAWRQFASHQMRIQKQFAEAWTLLIHESDAATEAIRDVLAQQKELASQKSPANQAAEKVSPK